MAKISHIVYLAILYCFTQNVFNFLMSLLIEGLWWRLWPLWLPLWPEIWPAFLISFWQSMIVYPVEGLESPLFYLLLALFVTILEFLMLSFLLYLVVVGLV